MIEDDSNEMTVCNDKFIVEIRVTKVGEAKDLYDVNMFSLIDEITTNINELPAYNDHDEDSDVIVLMIDCSVDLYLEKVQNPLMKRIEEVNNRVSGIFKMDIVCECELRHLM
ncbi:MAG: hypothetical protein HQM14_18225 [SAR324 cluster bacterium]|nr:hypothetical protein [SAR324 cluster bacterium]